MATYFSRLEASDRQALADIFIFTDYACGTSAWTPDYASGNDRCRIITVQIQQQAICVHLLGLPEGMPTSKCQGKSAKVVSRLF